MDNLAMERDSTEEIEMNSNDTHRSRKQVLDEILVSRNGCSHCNKESKSEASSNENVQDNEGMLYGILDIPPWWVCIPMALQHNLELITASVAVPFLLSPAICMQNDDPDKAILISTLIFMSGIITIMQSTFGNCLPICQGGSFSYLVPSLAIMNLEQWRCPANLDELGEDEKREVWQVRMRELQGAIMCASLVEVLLAFTGCIGWLLKYVTPITVAPALMIIGLSLFRRVMEQCSKNYLVSVLMVILLIIFSQHLQHIKISFRRKCATENRDNKNESNGFPIFQVLPILLALIVVWSVCGVLTAFDILTIGDAARVDAKKRILEEAFWFRIPYPFQFGWPTVSIGAVIGILCGVLTSTVESIGDYYCCASIIKAPVPPEHAISRGIFVEGLGCVLSGIIGTGNGSTSHSHNIGTLGITKVGSRRVIQLAGCAMLLFGMVGKLGGIFVSLPDPILGGLFLFLFPLVVAVGMSNLKDVSLESSRNLFIVSFSIFLGLAVSQWVSSNPGLIQTGSTELNSLLTILLSTGMFVAGFTAFILDNTVAGTDEERGLKPRQKAAEEAKLRREPTYDLPFGMRIIERYNIFKWFPISPTYEKHPITLLRSKSSNYDASSQGNTA